MSVADPFTRGVHRSRHKRNRQKPGNVTTLDDLGEATAERLRRGGQTRASRKGVKLTREA